MASGFFAHTGTASKGGAAAAALCLLLNGRPTGMCENNPQHTENISPEGRLKHWLAGRGCQVANLEIRPSKQGKEAGYGLFVAPDAKPMRSLQRRWWWPFGAPPPFTTAATFPLSSALTAANILADPQVLRAGWLHLCMV